MLLKSKRSDTSQEETGRKLSGTVTETKERDGRKEKVNVGKDAGKSTEPLPGVDLVM